MPSKEHRDLVRECTDVPWLVMFILIWLSMVAIAIFSCVYGRPLSVIYGYDSFGNICGAVQNEKYLAFPLSGLNMKRRPYLFFFDYNNTKETIRICVSRCPDVNISTSIQLHEYHTYLQTSLCRYDYDESLLTKPKTNNGSYLHRLGPCPPMDIVGTVPLLHTCLPKCYDKNTPCQENLNNFRSFTQLFLSDLHTKWNYLVVIVLLAIGFSFGAAMAIHLFPRTISCLICFTYYFSGITFVAILLFTYFNERNKDLHSDSFQKYILLAVSGVSITITIIMVTTSYLFRAKIRKVAKLFKEASQCLLNLPSIWLLPFLALVLLLSLVTFELYVIMHLASSSYPRVQSYSLNFDSSERTTFSSHDDIYHNILNSTDSYKTFNYIEHVEVHWLRTMTWLHVVGFIWTVEFISACLQMVIAGTVAHYYFNKSKKSPVVYMVGKLIKYHLGSAAKGAFLINIFRPIRIILAFSYMRLKSGESNGCRYASFGVRSCGCCFWLLDKFLRYWNHNVYAVIAVESTNFAPAAEVAWNTTYLLASSSRERAFGQAADLILFLAKLLVTTICGIVGILIFYPALDVYLYSLLLILCISLAYSTSHIILTTFEMVIDILSLCNAESKVINVYTMRWGQGYPAHIFEEQIGTNGEPLMPLFEMTPTKNNN